MYNQSMAENTPIPTELNLVDFIAGAAHDLKSPFSRSLGFLKLVLKGMDGPLSDQAREDLTISYQNNQYALLLMSSLIEAARLGSPLYLADCSLEQLSAQAAADWKKHYPKQKNAAVVVVAQDIQVRVDEILMRRCLVYWLNYLLEFVPETAGPPPEVNLQIEALQAGPNCELTLRSHAVQTQTPPNHEQTLYGYIARRIVELHGGVLLRSEVGAQEALIQFTIPLTQGD